MKKSKLLEKGSTIYTDLQDDEKAFLKRDAQKTLKIVYKRGE